MIRRSFVAALSIWAGVGCAGLQRSEQREVPLAGGDEPSEICKVEVSNASPNSVVLYYHMPGHQSVPFAEVSAGGGTLLMVPCSPRYVWIYGNAVDSRRGPPIATIAGTGFVELNPDKRVIAVLTSAKHR
jgi:hypothetical protein